MTRRTFRVIFFVGLFVLLSLGPSAVQAMPPLPSEYARGVKLSPDGTLVAAGKLPFEGDESRPGSGGYVQRLNLVRIWKVATGEQYRVYPSDSSLFSFSPDSQYIAIHQGGSIDIIHIASDKKVAMPGIQGGFGRFRFSPDSHWFIGESELFREPSATNAPQEGSTSYRRVVVWNMSDPAATAITQKVAAPYTVRYLPSGPNFVPGEVIAENKKPAPCNRAMQGDQKVATRAFSNDGQLQADRYYRPYVPQPGPDTAEDTIYLFDPPSCEPLLTLKGKVHTIWFSPGGRWLLGGGYDQLVAWSLKDGARSILDHDSRFHAISVDQLTTSLSSDENRIAIVHGFSYYDSNKAKPVLSVYDLQTGQRISSSYIYPASNPRLIF